MRRSVRGLPDCQGMCGPTMMAMRLKNTSGAICRLWPVGEEGWSNV